MRGLGQKQWVFIFSSIFCFLFLPFASKPTASLATPASSCSPFLSILSALDLICVSPTVATAFTSSVSMLPHTSLKILSSCTRPGALGGVDARGRGKEKGYRGDGKEKGDSSTSGRLEPKL